MFKTFVALSMLFLVGCNTKQEGRTNFEMVLYGGMYGSAGVVPITLQDGTKCVVVMTTRAPAISCNFKD